MGIARTQTTKLLIVAVVLLLAAAAGVSYALLSRDEDKLTSFAPAKEGDCAEVTGGGSTAELKRVVPKARSFSVTAGDSLDEKLPALRCEVRADGESAVEILLNGANGKQDWAKEITGRSLLWPSGRHPVKYAYAEGWSGSRAAALYLPCPGREATDRGGFGLTVVAQPKGAEHEADLRRLAQRTAKSAADRLKCEKAPDGD